MWGVAEPPIDITDPIAMRALAHPLRLQLLRLLKEEGPSTATRLAAACHESSGATSFHLRQLAKYGFIQDIPRRGNGRERWWRARSGHFRFSAPASANSDYDAAASLLRSRILDQNAASLAEFLEHEPELEAAWRDATLFGNTTTYLTLPEMDEISARVFELLHAFSRQDPDTRPPAARRVRFILYGLPEASAPRPVGKHEDGS